MCCYDNFTIKIQVYYMFIEMKYIILIDNNKRETIIDRVYIGVFEVKEKYK